MQSKYSWHKIKEKFAFRIGKSHILEGLQGWNGALSTHKKNHTLFPVKLVNLQRQTTQCSLLFLKLCEIKSAFYSSQRLQDRNEAGAVTAQTHLTADDLELWTEHLYPLEMLHSWPFKKGKIETQQDRCGKSATWVLIATICNLHFPQIHILFLSSYS